MEKIPGKKVTPLWIVAAFVTLTEAILGIAVTQVQGGVQIALTIFVITFGIFVAVAFFLILWNRPYVFYPPSEYKDSDPTRFVEAMKKGMNKFELNLDHLNDQLNLARNEIVNEAVHDVGVASEGARQQVELAVSNQMEKLRKHVTKLQEVAGEIKVEFIGMEGIRKKVLEFLKSDDYHPMTSYGIAQRLEIEVPDVKDALQTLEKDRAIISSLSGKFRIYEINSSTK